MAKKPRIITRRQAAGGVGSWAREVERLQSESPPDSSKPTFVSWGSSYHEPKSGLPPAGSSYQEPTGPTQAELEAQREQARQEREAQAEREREAARKLGIQRSTYLARQQQAARKEFGAWAKSKGYDIRGNVQYSIALRKYQEELGKKAEERAKKEEKKERRLVVKDEKIYLETKYPSGTISRVRATPEQEQYYLRQTATAEAVPYPSILQKTTGAITQSKPYLALKGSVGDPIVQNYKKFDNFLKENVTSKLPSGEELFGTRGQRAVVIAESQEKLPSWMRLSSFEQKFSGDVLGFSEGAYRGIKEKPAKTLVTAGVFFALPPVLSGVGKIPAVATFSTTSAGKLLGTGAKYGLPALYTGSVVGRVYGAEDRALKLGEISSTEIAPMVSGGYAGTKFWTKAGDIWRTWGRKEIQVEDILLKDIFTKKKTLVESGSYGYTGSPGYEKQRFDIGIFEKKGYGYHTTPEEFWDIKFTTAKGTSEIPGLYVAPSPSIYFAKAGKQPTSFYGGSFFQPLGTPAIAQIYPKGFTIKTASYGEAFVTGIKPEIEAVIPPGAEFYKTTGDFYIKWEGRRIPIDTFTLTADTGRAGASTNTIKDIYSSYRGLGTPSYAVTPSSLLLGTGLSLTSSTTSSKISTPSYSYAPKLSSSIVSPPSRISVSKSSKLKKPSYISKSYVSKTSLSRIYKSSLSKLYKSSYKPSYTYQSYTRYPSPPKPPKYPLLPSLKTMYRRQGRKPFSVQVRRYGKYRTVGTGDLRKVQSIGRGLVAGTLAATYKITGPSLKGLRTPKGFYRKTSRRGETLFIEKRKYRLSKPREKREIRVARARKSRKRRRRGLFDF